MSLATTHLFSFCVLLIAVSGENCDKLGIRLYEDLGCEAVKGNGPCPTSFNCPLLQAKDKCVFQGKTYNSGDGFPKNKFGFSCQYGCICAAGNGGSRVSCVQFGCAEWGPDRLGPNCYHGYNLENCCSSGQICPPFNDTTTCVVDGVEYKAGQRFAPKDSCHTCLCQKGFNGKFVAPFCKRSGCDAQINNQNDVQKFCAPVYVKDEAQDGEKVCCPKIWTCPDGKEVVTTADQKSDLTCKYGDRVFNLGDSFEKTIQYLFRDKKITCKCAIPPLMSCS